MLRFTLLATVVAASLAGFAHPSLAFGLRAPHIHMPHPSPTFPASPFANAGGVPSGWGR